METETEAIVTDVRDFRLMQMSAAANALAAEEPDAGRCIEYLKNVMSTEMEGKAREEMVAALKDSQDHMNAVDEEWRKKGFKVLMPGDLDLFADKQQKTVFSPGYRQGVRMFYDKMFGVLLRYALIKEK